MKKSQVVALFIGVTSLVVGILLVKFTSLMPTAAIPEVKQNVQDWDYKISGPYTQENLTIFLIRGEEKINGWSPLTLEEALERKQVVVHETSEVNELAIENVSQDQEVFVQAGDIVKGGKQDRVLAVDLIVPPRSGKMPIYAFCVESGRWSRRGTETPNQFTLSTDMAATKDLKIAAKRGMSQTEVWSKVGEAQAKLSVAARTEVRSDESASSLQLSLENPKVQETADNYMEELVSVIEGKDDVIGYAFAINGQINSADIYASVALFKKLWPKLLKATAIEAIAESSTDKKFEPVTVDAIKSFFEDAERGSSVTERAVTDRIKMSTRESEKSVFLETQDLKQNELWIHRNYIMM